MHRRDKIHIRSMLDGDLVSVSDLENNIFSHPWKKQDFMVELLYPQALCILVLKEEKILGYLCARRVADGTEILKVAVHPACRRQGLACLLIKEAVFKAKESDWPVLFLEVASTNTMALAFYQSQGFIITGIRKGYYPDGTDAMNMMKHL